MTDTRIDEIRKWVENEKYTALEGDGVREARMIREDDLTYLFQKLDAAERMAVAIADDQRSTGPFKPSQNTLSALAAFRAAGKETS